MAMSSSPITSSSSAAPPRTATVNLGSATPPSVAPSVIRARQRMASGFYDRPEMLDAVLDRLADDLAI